MDSASPAEDSSFKTKILKTLEFIPIVGFGLSWYLYKDIYLSTWVLFGFMTLFIVTAKLLKHPLTHLQVGSWIAVLVLGGLTLSFREELFIKWKTTFINSILATVLLLSHTIGKKTIAERLLDKKLKAPVFKLRRLNLASAIYFIASGIINIVIAYKMDTDHWVQFKLFGMFALNSCFMFGCIYYLWDAIKIYLDEQQKG